MESVEIRQDKLLIVLILCGMFLLLYGCYHIGYKVGAEYFDNYHEEYKERYCYCAEPVRSSYPIIKINLSDGEFEIK